MTEHKWKLLCRDCALRSKHVRLSSNFYKWRSHFWRWQRLWLKLRYSPSRMTFGDHIAKLWRDLSSAWRRRTCVLVDNAWNTNSVQKTLKSVLRICQYQIICIWQESQLIEVEAVLCMQTHVCLMRLGYLDPHPNLLGRTNRIECTFRCHHVTSLGNTLIMRFF
jgi:hypothetical protein